jgi:hypothetical protein
VYWPQDDDGAASSKIQDLLEDPEPVETGLVPEFQAEVTASVDIDIRVTPEAHIGIQVGGSGILNSVTLVDAQLVGYVNSTLRFHADATGTLSTTDASVAYNYGVYLLYNIGYGGWATIPLYAWQVTSRNLFDTPKVITLYSNGDVLSTTLKRDVPQITPREFDNLEVGLLNSEDGLELNDFESESVLAEARIVGIDGDLLWSSGSEVVNISRSQNIGPYKKGLQTRQDSSVDPEATDNNSSPDFSLGTLTCPATSCESSDGTTTKRATNTCGWVLPDFRYNCRIFSDRQLTNANTGQSTVVPGICTNVNKFLTARALSSNGLALTWEPLYNEARRKFVCGSGTFCATQNIITMGSIGLSTGITAVSCDEFPIASSEEGGSFFGTLPNNPTTAAATCVPVWQQALQGNCHSMLSSLHAVFRTFLRSSLSFPPPPLYLCHVCLGSPHNAN